ncbi:MAG: hypothetical protein AAF063_33745 [Cyanobacteria bacterium J06643_5]
MSKTLDECAAKYRGFCQKYKPKAKAEKRYFWGNQFLLKMLGFVPQPNLQTFDFYMVPGIEFMKA